MYTAVLRAALPCTHAKNAVFEVPLGDRSCLPHATRRQIPLWPQALEAWIDRRYRRNQLIPAVHPDCRHLQPPITSQLQISYLHDGSTLLASDPTRLPTVTLAGEGAVGWIQWYANGRLVAEVSPETVIPFTPAYPGNWQFIAIDERGSLDRVTVRVARR